MILQGHLLEVNIRRTRVCHQLCVWSWRCEFAHDAVRVSNKSDEML